MTSLTVVAPKITILDHAINMVDGLYSLNDMHKASGGEKKHQPAFFVRNKEVEDLIDEIKHSANLQSDQVIRKINGGNKRGTYVCKELVYRYAMWVSAKFALIVIRTFDAVVQGQSTQLKQVNRLADTADRKPLVDAVNTYCAKSGAIYSDVWKMVHQRFGVTKVDQLTIEQIPHAVEYIHQMTVSADTQNETPTLEYLTTAKHEALEYVWELQRTIVDLGGKLPKFPDINRNQLAQGIITRLLMSNRILLSFDNDVAPKMKFIPNNHMVVTEDNLTAMIESVSSSKMPDIIETAAKRLKR